MKLKNMLDEFKSFILKGNMIDLAVGIIIGAAFGKLVESFAGALVSTLGWLLKTCKFPTEWLNAVAIPHDGPNIGPVIIGAINLVIVGFALFIFIKAYNKFLIKPRPADPTPPPPSEEVKLLMEIRDALRK